MSNELPSVVDLINANKKKREAKQGETAAEIATVTAKQQQLMERAGELDMVHLLGPNDTRIPAYYSKAENAFLPVFKAPN